MKRPPELERELTLAREARLRGNEGRARVCARRAAGMAARVYLDRRGVRARRGSVIDLLTLLLDDPDLDENNRIRIRRLAMRVDPEFKLPPDIDLIAEADALCDNLLG